jgi:hypothetical protein
MEEPYQDKAPKPQRKWLQRAGRVIAWAAFWYCLYLILDATGMESWKKFEQRADKVAENIKTNAYRLTPVKLWTSLTRNEPARGNSPAEYLPGYQDTTPMNAKEKALSFLGLYWYTDAGKPFWVGRILLLMAVLFAVLLANGEVRNAINRTSRVFWYPFNVVLKTLLVLVVFGLACFPVYFILKLFLWIGAGIVGITTSVHLAGSFVAFLVSEVKGDMADSTKKWLGPRLFPALYSKKARKPPFPDGPVLVNKKDTVNTPVDKV